MFLTEVNHELLVYSYKMLTSDSFKKTFSVVAIEMTSVRNRVAEVGLSAARKIKKNIREKIKSRRNPLKTLTFARISNPTLKAM